MINRQWNKKVRMRKNGTSQRPSQEYFCLMRSTQTASKGRLTRPYKLTLKSNCEYTENSV